MKNKFSERNKLFFFFLAILFITAVLLSCGFIFNNKRAVELSRYESDVFYPVVSSRDELVLLNNDGNYSEDEYTKYSTYGVVDSVSRMASSDHKEKRQYSWLNGFFWRRFGSQDAYNLSLDTDLSGRCYRALEAREDEFEIGIIAVCDKNGKLIVCTEYPVVPGEKPDPPGLYVCDALYSTFVPGSIFKAVIISSYLENGGSESLVFNCDGDLSVIDSGTSATVTCPISHGEQSLEDLIINSCNCGMAFLGLKIGSSNMEKTLEDFGLNEEISLMDSLGIYSAGSSFQFPDRPELAASSFGQGNDLVNPLSILRFINSLANNGNSVDITIEQDVIPNSKQIMSEKTAETVSSMMYSAGASYGFNNVAAKTGTAQIGDGLYNSWLVGFNDEYTFVILLHNTEKSGLAGAGTLYRELEPTLDAYKWEKE